MKKLLTFILVAVMLFTICIPASATETAAKATDITADVKVATAFDIYENKLPVVRLDAKFLPSGEFTNDTTAADWKAPGSGNRTVNILGDTNWENFFGDPGWLLSDDDVTCFYYPCNWSNTTSPLTYSFTIETPGNYEFVVVGCAEITPANRDNDAKDRGFCLSVDGGEKLQVNISDTVGAFCDGYVYDYNHTDLQAGLDKVTTTNGVNSAYYQMTYYYGISMYLTAGEHTYEYWPLEYSGETDVSGGTSSRLNYFGTYIQAELTEAELGAYTYPEVTTEAPDDTTKAPDDTTKAPNDTTATPNDTTANPNDTTKAPGDDTTAAGGDEGCASIVGGGAVMLLAICATGVVIRRRK